MISPSTGRGRLYGSLKDLRLLWEETQKIWDDPVSRDFETNLLEPLVAQSQVAIRGIDRLAQVLHQMQIECE
jgi:hypothetical protein